VGLVCPGGTGHILNEITGGGPRSAGANDYRKSRTTGVSQNGKLGKKKCRKQLTPPGAVFYQSPGNVEGANWEETKKGVDKNG